MIVYHKDRQVVYIIGETGKVKLFQDIFNVHSKLVSSTFFLLYFIFTELSTYAVILSVTIPHFIISWLSNIMHKAITQVVEV